MQREFEIFTKPSSAPVAVKRGFCWPGFFLIWIWAFSRGLLLPGIFILLADVVILFLKFSLLSGQPIICGLLSLALSIFVGFKGNFWRSSKLERNGYGFERLIPARSGKSALTAFARGEKTSTGISGGLISLPKPFQRIFAICWLTWKAALRFRLFLVIAALLILAVVGLPLVIKDDGTARGFTQIILTYTLSAITSLLGLSTLWLSCGTLARDIEECQIQVVATKPIARWQIWLGKWLGIVSLNAILLLISGGCVFGLLQWRAAKLPAAEQKILHEQILVARGSAKPQDISAEIDEAAAGVLKDREKADPDLVKSPYLTEVTKQIHEQVKAQFQLVPPGYQKAWQIDLGFAKNYLQDKPLQLRVKFNAADKSSSGTFTLGWIIGIAGTTNYWVSEPMSLSPSTTEDQSFHEFQIPANLYDKNGMLTIMVANPNNTSLLFPLEDGMEVLYPSGGFGPNFARGLGIIFCWLALMAAMGLMSASFLSFPVATFFSIGLMMVVMSSGTLADSVNSGSVAAGNEETGQAGHSVMDIVLIPAFKGMLSVIQLVQNYSPIDALSTGREIPWLELATAFTQIVLVLGGFFGLIGVICLHRRELATAQGTQ